ncbi:hypothetical protein DFP72DRAFT_846727 [Ephemerocybe angulata]|uniref:Uncharacterized protein n=1 Tax=Ephemerocybe angulata TaxID=980116 RepID=A0A8H6I2V5_9AGAR|nr:hypothetical protein DFP72DRAFT_846727 [Tulosesus angulatus]
MDSGFEVETIPILPTTPTPETPPSAPQSTAKKRQVRATVANPYHGHVAGAQRGIDTFKIVRKHAPPAPLDSTKDAAAYFNQSIGPIIERCEDIARKTGCWLFIGAQHITAQNGMVHYVSPRLVSDAPEEIEDITNELDDLIRGLRKSRRHDALRVCVELAEAEREKQRLAAELQAMKQKELETAELLHRLQAQGSL